MFPFFKLDMRTKSCHKRGQLKEELKHLRREINFLAGPLLKHFSFDSVRCKHALFIFNIES